MMASNLGSYELHISFKKKEIEINIMMAYKSYINAWEQMKNQQLNDQIASESCKNFIKSRLTCKAERVKEFTSYII